MSFRVVFQLFIALCCVFVFSTVETATSDQILSIPGYNGTLNSKMYGGFVTVDTKYNDSLYYWFIESESNPKIDPIIVWLQGGPGCSSLFGAFVENGPFLISEDGVISKNPFSWNAKASLLYIDSPPGTGYSYEHTSGGYAHDEETVSKYLYTLISTFLFKLHPEYSTQPFFVFGESYGGKYVPWIAYTILQNNQQSSSKVNLKGIATGDGWSVPSVQTGSYAPFLYENKLINSLEVDIANGVYYAYLAMYKLGDYDSADTIGNTLLNTLVLAAGNVDVYDIRYTDDPTDVLQDALTVYLNKPEVRNAFHAGNQKWTACANGPYFGLSEDIELSVESLFPKILESIPVLLYNGDKDLICNYIGTASWSNAMVWSHQQDYVRAKNQTWSVGNKAAGYYKTAGGLTHLVVFDAGHMSPYSQPENCQAMAFQFISGGFNY